MILNKWDNKSVPVTYRNSHKPIEIPQEYTEKPFRALWVSNVVNIDMPTIENIAIYDARMQEIIDTCKAYNLNAIFFQLRTTNDAFYQSNINPYSRYLTGKEGKEPPYDVVAKMIELCHAHRIEFHAWCNPYRISSGKALSKDEYLKTCDEINYALRHPEDILTDTKGHIILNPSRENVKAFLVETLLELAKNYPIDGIHFDDYFYPYAGLDANNDDALDYQKRDNLEQSLGDFRRFHVDDLVYRIHIALKTHHPTLQFGISPFGIWRNADSDSRGSNTDQACSQSYDNQYANTLKWIEEGWVDYIVPQVYWEFEHPIAPFADIVDWWKNVCEGSSVKLYIGHAAYRLGNAGPFENPKEIIHQVRYANQYDAVKGNVFFTFKTFIDKDKAYPGMQTLKALLTRRI